MTATIASRGTAQPRPRRTGRGQGRAGLLFTAPFLIIFLAFFVSPLVYAAYLSLFREQLIGGVTFAGFDNYTRALQDPDLRNGVLRVARFFVLQVPVMLAISLLAALAIDSGLLRWSKLFRIGFFVPYAVPAVVATLMWGYLYGPDFGPFAQLAGHLGLPAPDFLGRHGAFASMANVVTWEFAGYNMIILYAALRAVPSELYEAAVVDGASQEPLGGVDRGQRRQQLVDLELPRLLRRHVGPAHTSTSRRRARPRWMRLRTVPTGISRMPAISS